MTQRPGSSFESPEVARAYLARPAYPPEIPRALVEPDTDEVDHEPGEELIVRDQRAFRRSGGSRRQRKDQGWISPFGKGSIRVRRIDRALESFVYRHVDPCSVRRKQVVIRF